GAISSAAKRRTMSRSASMSSPSPKFSAFSYISLLPARFRADQPHGHGQIGFGDFVDRQPLVRPEPDDDAGDHLDDRHRRQRAVFDAERAVFGALAQNGAQFLFVAAAQLENSAQPLARQAAQLHIVHV